MVTSEQSSRSFDSNICTMERQHLHLEPGKIATIVDNNARSHEYYGNITTIKLISEKELFDRGATVIPRALSTIDSNNAVPFAALECIGPFIPCCFYPLDSIYNVISTAETAFDDIELEGDGDWSDYDEKIGEPVVISGLEGIFLTYKECTSFPLRCFNTRLSSRDTTHLVSSSPMQDDDASSLSS